MYFGVPCESIDKTSREVKAEVVRIFSERDMLLREKGIFKNIDGIKHVNLMAVLASEFHTKTARRENGQVKLYATEIGDKLYIFPRVFVMNKQPVITNKYIPLQDFAALLGFYLCEGKKAGTFSITNSEKEVMSKFLEILCRNFDLSNFSKYCILHYVVDGREDKTEEELQEYWRDLLKKYRLKINLIRYSKTKSKDSKKKIRAKYGIFTFRIFSTSFLYTILGILNSPLKEKLITDEELSWEILRWVAAGDMFPKVCKGKLNAVVIATENSNEVGFYKKLLRGCGVRYESNNVTKNGEMLINGLDNFVKFTTKDLFKYIEYRKQKFLKGLTNLTSIKFLRMLGEEEFKLQNFSEVARMRASIASQLLNHHYKRAGLVASRGGAFKITALGKELMNFIGVKNAH